MMCVRKLVVKRRLFSIWFWFEHIITEYNIFDTNLFLSQYRTKVVYYWNLIELFIRSMGSNIIILFTDNEILKYNTCVSICKYRNWIIWDIKIPRTRLSTQLNCITVYFEEFWIKIKFHSKIMYVILSYYSFDKKIMKTVNFRRVYTFSEIRCIYIRVELLK